jgi:hypothetical protein
MADILAAISVLLVFLTLLLAGMQKDSEELLKTNAPLKAQTDNYNAFRKKVLWQIAKSLVITVVFFLIFWTLFPHTCKIISESNFAVWNFDELPTVFVLIELGVLGMFLFGLVYVIKLTIHYNKD